jgi:hypothetical protein
MAMTSSIPAAHSTSDEEVSQPLRKRSRSPEEHEESAAEKEEKEHIAPHDIAALGGSTWGSSSSTPAAPDTPLDVVPLWAIPSAKPKAKKPHIASGIWNLGMIELSDDE